MIVLAEEARADLERVLEFNTEGDAPTALEHLSRIRTAILILDEHPLIGRPVGGKGALRELIISHGKTGYIALYEHAQAEGVVRAVAIRHQREAGYTGR